jgi:hypothetical protein
MWLFDLSTITPQCHDSKVHWVKHSAGNQSLWKMNRPIGEDFSFAPHSLFRPIDLPNKWNWKGRSFTIPSNLTCLVG